MNTKLIGIYNMTVSYQEEMAYRAIPDVMSQNECSLHSAIRMTQNSDYTLNISVSGYYQWCADMALKQFKRSEPVKVEFTTPEQPVSPKKKTDAE